MQTPSVDLIRLFGLLGGAPATLIALTLLPWALYVATGEFDDEPLFSGINLALLAGTVFALATYWHLVVVTAQGRPYRFGLVFALAVIVAAALTLFLLAVFPALAIAAALPASLATIFLVRTQLRSAQEKKTGCPEGLPPVA